MLDLFQPHMPKSLEGLEGILRSGKLSGGAHVKGFERAVGGFLGCDNVLAVNSFNSAWYIALRALGLEPGDEVILSPVACLASALPLVAFGQRIVWADVDVKTGTLDPRDVERTIQAHPHVKAIAHNHFCGYPGLVDDILDVASRYGVAVIDDGIEAFGSRYKERLIGSAGADATVFSLGPVRMPNTIEGGIVCFARFDAYEKAMLLRDCGVDRRRFRDDLSEIDPRCDIELPGIAACMNEPAGFLGERQMEELPQLIGRQRQNAELLHEACGVANIGTLGRRGIDPNYWVFGTLVENKRAAIARLREAGFNASGVHADLSSYSVFGRMQRQLLGAASFVASFLALPCGWWVDDLEDNGELRRALQSI